MSIVLITALSERFRLRSDFAKHVLTLATGTAAAQALTILVAPFLSRLYRPEDYGLSALFGAVSGMIAMLSTAKYDAAILIPREDEAAVSLAALCLSITSAVSLAALCILLPSSHWLAHWLGEPKLAPWLLMIPLAVLFSGVAQTLGAWANRRQAYGTIAYSRIVAALLGTGASVAMGVAGMGAAGLILSFLLSQAAAVGVLAVGVGRNLAAAPHLLAPDAMWTQARRFANFPKFSLWVELLNNFSNHLVTLLLPRLFGVAVLGWYSMSQRVVGVPASIVGGAVSEVFRARASRDYAEHGHCRPIFMQTLRYLALLSVVPFSILALVAPDIFLLVFGEPWRMAGRIAQVMSIMFLLRFIVSPLTYTFLLGGKQREDLYLHMLLTGSTVAVLVVCHLYASDPVTMLLGFSINYSLIYLIYLWRSFTHACGEPALNPGRGPHLTKPMI